MALIQLLKVYQIRVNVIYCPAGKYCNADFDGYANLNSLPNCEAGYYCSGGSSSPTPLQDNILQDCWLTNSCDSSVTETCWENADLDEVGGICLPGFYCPEGSGRPIPCEAGFACPDFRMSTYVCEAGYYCPTGNKDTKSVVCPGGHYCPEGSAAPEPCPPGTYGKGGVEAISSDFCETGTSLFDSGLAYEGWGSTIDDNVECHEGWYCTARSTSRFGRVCPQHHNCPTDVSNAIVCPTGKWQPAVGSALCEPCPKGYFCHVEGNDHKIDSCEPGYYCVEGTTEPEPCPPGTYSQSSNLDAKDQCLTCPAGQYCLGGPELPANCSAGFYCGGGATKPNPDVSPYSL